MISDDILIDSLYGKNDFQKIENILDRRKAVGAKLGLSEDQLQGKFSDKDFRKKIFQFLSFKIANNKYTLQVSREELLLELLEELRAPLTTTKDEDKRLKALKLKGEVDMLCERLVTSIDQGYKEIYGDIADVARQEIRQSLSPEQRLKQKS